jgi:hypothetical protein
MTGNDYNDDLCIYRPRHKSVDIILHHWAQYLRQPQPRTVHTLARYTDIIV